MTRVLGIDGGASGTRWRLEGELGAPLAEGQVPPLTGHVFTAAARDAAAATITAIAEAVDPHGAPDFVVAGITGLSAEDEAARTLRALVATAVGLGVDRIAVLDDMRIAYLGAFGPGEGILLYAGTGAIAYHLARDQSIERAGGHGYLIDDAGGGFWIGRQALRAMLRRLDEDHSPTALDDAIADAIGSADWPDIRAHVYGGGRAAVAALARTVVGVAQRGDPEAHALLNVAGAELGRLAAVLRARLGEIPVALAGGIGRNAPAVADAVRRELGGGLRVHRVEPVVTAAALARAALGLD